MPNSLVSAVFATPDATRRRSSLVQQLLLVLNGRVEEGSTSAGQGTAVSAGDQLACFQVVNLSKELLKPTTSACVPC